jgi:RNA polymerase sigma-70 factor (ECF subfamily)
LQTLLEYIKELPNKYRTTFNLYVLDGHTHKEIGELLGTTAGTSKSNLARARILLKEKIETKVLQSFIGIVVIMGNYF